MIKTLIFTEGILVGCALCAIYEVVNTWLLKRWADSQWRLHEAQEKSRALLSKPEES